MIRWIAAMIALPTLFAAAPASAQSFYEGKTVRIIVGLGAANHIHRVAKPDGLTVGHFIGGQVLGQVLGQPGIEFDARKFEFIGAPVKEDVVCALTDCPSRW